MEKVAQHEEVILTLRRHNSQLQCQIEELTKKLEHACPQHNARGFHLFPRLPPELRRKIWRHGLPAPRVVNFDFISRFRNPPPHFETNYGPPSLLHVCRESREVALESYELVFKSKGTSRAFYFDLRRDTLCFTMQTTPIHIALFLDDMPAADVCRVRYLAVASELPKDLVKYITRFQGLEVFSLILSDPRVIAPIGQFDLFEAKRPSIWVTGAYWNFGLTSWGEMEMNLTSAFEDERAMFPDCRVPVVELVYTVSTRKRCCGDCPGHLRI